MNGEGVHASGQFAGKRLVDQTVTLEPGHTLEQFRYYIDPEMGLAARPVSGMAFVLVGFVHHLEALRGESLGQLLCDTIFGSHDARLDNGRAGVNAVIFAESGTRNGVKS